MVLLSTCDIDRLKLVNKEKKEADMFWNKYAYEIETELVVSYNVLRKCKSTIIDHLKENVNPVLNETYCDVLSVLSYDFSNVGGENAVYTTTPDGKEITYGAHASISSWGAYRYDRDGGRAVSRYDIWTKSKNFMKRLGERLQLPEGAYLTIVSEQLTEQCLFCDPTTILEYNNRLRLVVSL